MELDPKVQKSNVSDAVVDRQSQYIKEIFNSNRSPRRKMEIIDSAISVMRARLYEEMECNKVI